MVRRRNLERPIIMSKTISRRSVLKTGLAIGAGLSLVRPAFAEDKVLRVGYQKYGSLLLLRGKGTLEKALEPLGFKVTWAEFPGGPQLFEALNAGAIDFGTTGEAPPVFAQAAGAPLLYVGAEPPAPKGEAILVPKDSPIKTLADLKGKKIALNKGSNVHYLLVKALEKGGVDYKEIQPTFLPPADGRAAFEKGAVDAWAIWDPFFAAAQTATGGTILTDGEGIVSNTQFYFATKAFADANPSVVSATVKQIAELDTWANGNTDNVAEQLSSAVGIPKDVLKLALGRASFGVKPLDDATVAAQQKIADTFFNLGLLPKKISVADVIWKAPA